MSKPVTPPAPPSSPLGRRDLLRRTALFGGGLAATTLLPAPARAQAPAVVTSDAMRPQVAQGVMSGDPLMDRAMIWSRADRPARMIVEYSTTESFKDAQRVVGPYALEPTDFTARVELRRLPAGQDIFYRVSFVDAGDMKTMSVPVVGRLKTPSTDRRNITFLWSGDTAGQGWGINPDWDGMRIYKTMRALRPDFFIHNGDTIYADGPIPAEVKLDDGTIWKNLVTEEKSKVAESLKEFRGCYLYNLMDEHVRAFNAEVPQIWQWDDHEVTNNWSAAKDLSADKRYTEKRVPLLTARATKAFLDYAPMRFSTEETERVYRHLPYGPSLDVFVIDMRSYRGPNSYNRQKKEGADTDFLGRPQLRWLKEGLLASDATWKVIAADMPIGLQVGDGKDAEGRDKFENLANGDGPALGRELEIADLLRFIKHNKIRNVVWLTADTHYTGAHYYNPAKAQFTDFDPFWEFMSGPLHAGTFGPNKLDNTFGIEVVYTKHPEDGKVNLPPSAGMQFFGEVKIDGASEVMTVALKDLTGATLFQKALEPQRS